MKKISVLKQNTKAFINDVHIDGLHWGCVNAFDSDYRLGEMENDSESLKETVNSLSASGNTALYDAIIHSIEQLSSRHYDANRQGIPMFVVVVTDGKDNESRNRIDDVRRTIEEENFFSKNNCYLTIAGVGGDASESNLQRICANKYGLYRYSNDMSALGALYKLVVLLVKRQIAARKVKVEGDDFVAEEHQITGTTSGNTVRMDYALVLDSSGSMNNPA